jgi:hypothetical protein
VKIGKTLLGKEGLQHSGTTNIVLVNCNTLYSYVVTQSAGRVGLAEREGLVWNVRYREFELTLRGNITLEFIFMFIFIQTLLLEKEKLDFFSTMKARSF